ncbi:MAG TPA: periplasmic heavy metal sensor [Pseudomonadales bacterium]|nr:periplasmic heavy metal sensor [Pseudomonadales bacterium]
MDQSVRPGAAVHGGDRTMIGLPRWALVLIAVSLTVNLIGIGWIAGRLTAQSTDLAGRAHQVAVGTVDAGAVPGAFVPPFPPRPPSPGMGWIVEGMTSDRRAFIEMEIEMREEGLLQEAGAMSTLRADVREALTDQPFDAERLAQALAALRTQLMSTQAHSHGILVDVARDMTPSERTALARRFSGYIHPPGAETVHLLHLSPRQRADFERRAHEAAERASN